MRARKKTPDRTEGTVLGWKHVGPVGGVVSAHTMAYTPCASQRLAAQRSADVVAATLSLNESMVSEQFLRTLNGACRRVPALSQIVVVGQVLPTAELSRFYPQRKVGSDELGYAAIVAPAAY